MGWSDWYECSFDSKGEIDTRPVERYAPNQPGVYAIATKTSAGYSVKYIGMSRKSIWKRLQAHFRGKGNHVIRELLSSKSDGRSKGFEMLNALYFMFLETAKEDASWMEALYIHGTVPIANIQQNLTLPRALQNLKIDVEVEE